MKKKLVGFIIAFAFILTGTILLNACGKNTGISLHNKTYTLGTEVTWSCYVTDSNDKKTSIGNAVDYINNHWETIREYNSILTAGSQNGQQFLDALKARVLDPDDTYSDVLLVGAVIEIGKESKKNDRVWESTFECKMNNVSVAYFGKIYTDTIKKNRYKAYAEGGLFDFELTNYNDKSGKINNIYTKFQVKKALNSGSESSYIWYSNVTDIRVFLGNSQFLHLEGKIGLVSVE